MLPLTIESAHELYRQMEWADARTWGAVDDAPAEHEAELIDRLYHIHFTQRAFLQLWISGPREKYDPARFANRGELRAWAMTYYPDVSAFLGTVDVERFPEPLLVPWARLYERQLGRTPAMTTFGETIFQVWSHTTSHRAQIGTRLRHFGVEPPLVDFIAWIWAGRPQPSWAATSQR